MIRTGVLVGVKGDTSLYAVKFRYSLFPPAVDRGKRCRVNSISDLTKTVSTITTLGIIQPETSVVSRDACLMTHVHLLAMALWVDDGFSAVWAAGSLPVLAYSCVLVAASGG